MYQIIGMVNTAGVRCSLLVFVGRKPHEPSVGPRLGPRVCPWDHGGQDTQCDGKVDQASPKGPSCRAIDGWNRQPDPTWDHPKQPAKAAANASIVAILDVAGGVKYDARNRDTEHRCGDTMFAENPASCSRELIRIDRVTAIAIRGFVMGLQRGFQRGWTLG